MPRRACLSGVSLWWCAMAKTRRDIKIKRVASQEPMQAHECQTAEDLLAVLFARSFAADHPELFSQKQEDRLHEHED